MRKAIFLTALISGGVQANPSLETLTTPASYVSNAPGQPDRALPTHLLLNLDARETQFKPFKKEDFFGEDYNLYDYVLIPRFGRVEPITVEEYLDRLNRSENLLAKIGRSLRNNDPSVIVNALANPEIFYRQIANELGLSQKALIEGVKENLESCPLLESSDFSVDLERRVEVNNGLNVKVKDLIPQLNQQQELFCSLGYTMISDEIHDVTTLIQEALPRRDEILAALDLDENHRLVQIAQWAQSLNPKEIEARIAEIREAIKNPTPEQVYNLAQVALDYVPEAGLQLPALPRVEGPQLARRNDLKLKKRYEWKGIDEGDPKIAQVKLGAWAELRAGKADGGVSEYDTEQAFQAEGKGGFVFLSNPVDVFSATFDSGISPTNAKAVTTACLLRVCLSETLIDRQANDWQYGDKLLDESWDFPYAQQFFIGPIPVVVRAMVIASAYSDWDLGFTLVSVDGGMKGQLKAVAAVEGGIGLQDFVEAGAGGQMTIVDNTTTIRGSALIASSESGAPFITGSLIGDNSIKSLNGSIYGYALVDVMGPLGEYLDAIVDSIASLGEAGQRIISYLDSIGSDLGKKVAKKIGNEINKAGKNIEKILTGRKKLFKKPIGAGVGYGLAVNGTKIRYQQDVITWPAYENAHRFLNYKIYIGPDGKEYGGDAGQFNPEQLKAIEEEVDLKIREAKVANEEARMTNIYADFFNATGTYLNSRESTQIPGLRNELQRAFEVIEANRNAALRDLNETVKL